MPIATWSRIGEWLRLLVFRRRASVPEKFRGLWLLSWLILATVALCRDRLDYLLFFALTATVDAVGRGNCLAGRNNLAAIVGPGHYAVLRWRCSHLSSPNPRNIEARHAIRSAGIALLDRLHELNDFDRIIIVGHSLGSVIGYDILTHAWQHYHERHGCLDAPTNTALEEAQRLAEELGTQAAPHADAAAAWRRASSRLWFEQRNAGCPWLVTDFVTLGSPLAHADLLLANNPADLLRRVHERELPICPPVLEKGGVFSFAVNYRSAEGNPRTTFVLHHAACFALTRWTNLYFPSRWLFFGDLIGGPLTPLLGRGIRDIAVETPIHGGWIAHTSYWSHPQGSGGSGTRDRASAGRAGPAVKGSADVRKRTARRRDRA